MSRPSLFLLLLNLVLAGTVLAGMQGAGPTGSDPAAPVRQTAAVAHTQENRMFALPAFETYVETGERPLFTAGRRPAIVSSEAAQETKTDLPQISLVGIIIGQVRRTALFQNATFELIRVSEGERLQGWILEEVHSNRVVFRREAVQKTLMLDWKPNEGVAKEIQPNLINRSKRSR